MKRFAKIAGEMVSLGVVENCASATWPNNTHAATILPDKRKGEQIILVTDRKDPDRPALLAWAQSHGVPEIAVPKKIITLDEIPVLGTGKLDHVTINKLAKDHLETLANTPAPEPELTKQEMKEARKREKLAAKEAKKAEKEALKAANDDDEEQPKAAE